MAPIKKKLSGQPIEHMTEMAYNNSRDSKESYSVLFIIILVIYDEDNQNMFVNYWYVFVLYSILVMGE